ncbi:hypothetical protein BLOT_014486, partial [Blomia tropicalis]
MAMPLDADFQVVPDLQSLPRSSLNTKTTTTTTDVTDLTVTVLNFVPHIHVSHCASVPNVYNRSPFTTHRLRYEQTGPHVSREQFTNAFKEALGDVRTSLKSHADNFD